LLPALVERGRAHAFEHAGYWRDVGVPLSYLEAHMDFLDGPPFALDDPGWPILSRPQPRMPARIRGGKIQNSLISPGCDVRGNVRRCVLAPGVVVEEGAELEDCVIGHNAVIEGGVHLRRAIVDEGTHVRQGAQGGEEPVIIADIE
jgi:glucose-1-phosphate adenylyltransferase